MHATIDEDHPARASEHADLFKLAWNTPFQRGHGLALSRDGKQAPIEVARGRWWQTTGSGRVIYAARRLLEEHRGEAWVPPPDWKTTLDEQDYKHDEDAIDELLRTDWTWSECPRNHTM